MTKLVKRLKKTVLLEDETGFMFHVPVEIYDEGGDLGENAIPYSLPFDLILGEIDFSAVQSELYGAGIHTLADILNNRKRVNDILRKYISADVLIRNIKGDI